MKRLINVVAVIAMLGCCNLYAEDGGTAQAAENVADKGDAQEQEDKGNKPKEKDVPELKEEATKPERAVDFSLYVAILALLTAAVSIVLLLQYKGKAANEKKSLDTNLSNLRNRNSPRRLFIPFTKVGTTASIQRISARPQRVAFRSS